MECESWLGVTPGGMSPDLQGSVSTRLGQPLLSGSECLRLGIDLNGPKILNDTHKYPLPLANVRNVLQGEAGLERERGRSCHLFLKIYLSQ